VEQFLPMIWKSSCLVLLLAMSLTLSGCTSSGKKSSQGLQNYTLNFTSPINRPLQAKLERIDSDLRAKYHFTTNLPAVGVLDLNTQRLALINPDQGDYAASVAKVGILLAYFYLHPKAATNLDAETRHELGMMAKISSNEMAAKYSKLMGLHEIQAVLNSYGLYDKEHGGGIWVGRHYGKSDERYGDPLGDNSHAATVRQLMRYFVWLEQGKLVSPEASKTMREIFETPDLPHDYIKFVKGLAGRDVKIIRKWGSWENWLHDSAVVTGGGRHYILVAMTNHPKGDEYLADLAAAVDDILIAEKKK
jgi:beta-lactamase class A